MSVPVAHDDARPSRAPDAPLKGRFFFFFHSESAKITFSRALQVWAACPPLGVTSGHLEGKHPCSSCRQAPAGPQKAATRGGRRAPWERAAYEAGRCADPQVLPRGHTVPFVPPQAALTPGQPGAPFSPRCMKTRTREPTWLSRVRRVSRETEEDMSVLQELLCGQMRSHDRTRTGAAPRGRPAEGVPETGTAWSQPRVPPAITKLPKHRVEGGHQGLGRGHLRPGTQQPAARSVPQARGPWGRAEAGLRCGRGAPGLQVLEKQRPVRAHGQEGTGLVEKKGDRKEGRRPRELLTREKRKERETGRQKRARSALRSPLRSRGHRGPDHPITGSLDHRGQRSLETDWGGLCRTLLGGQKGVLSSWDAAQASSHRLPGADSAEQQKAQHKVQPSPGTDHRAQRAGPRCSRVKCTQTTIKSRSQKHKSPPEMDQKQKQRHDMNLKQEMEEDKILITKHPRRAE